jgi:nicotinate-nucleotide--dimethylbenzimidazole phosphoribosyltransferase
MDAAGLERKRTAVARALERNGLAAGALPDPRFALRAVGGLELAALAGAAAEAARRRLPVILDGYPVSVAALAAVRMDPLVGEALLASHRSAEPGHARVLEELGLEPVLDLRLRLGEGSGALLALPVIEAAGALHAAMATFEEAGVARR